MKKQILGQSLFEVVVALFIITLIIIAVVSLSTVSIANSLFSKNKTLSSRYSQEAIEWLRSQKETDPDTFFSLSANTYCLNTLDENTFLNLGECSSNELVSGFFTRELELTNQVVASKTVVSVTVITSWDDSKGIHESRSSTDFSDRRDQ